MTDVCAFLRETAKCVTAYRAFLGEHGVDPNAVLTLEHFARVPLMTREGYLARYPLADRCRDGDLSALDMVAFSSGSTGEPTLWPRTAADEQAVIARFEQVFRGSFEADRKKTLAVVAFPLGTWVGGMYTASSCRHLASRDLRITTVTPGNDRAEILRVVRALGPLYDQTVLLGYPPFVKDVIDFGRAQGLSWAPYSIKLVLAGEVFSEEWRSLMAERAAMKRILHDSASLYGTADAGVLGVETPLSIALRRFCAENAEAGRALFGSSRLPTLVQYDPETRYFETHEGTLVLTADGGVPLVRYHIADDGGIIPHDEMITRARSLGFASDETDVALPFVYVFGRSHFAISFYGANVFPEMVSLGLEQAEVRAWVTGKFVMEARETGDKNRRLTIAVELAPQVIATDTMRETIARALVVHLRRLSSEFAHYVPTDAQTPDVTLLPAGDPGYFPAGVKHRYVRRSCELERLDDQVVHVDPPHVLRERVGPVDPGDDLRRRTRERHADGHGRERRRGGARRRFDRERVARSARVRADEVDVENEPRPRLRGDGSERVLDVRRASIGKVAVAVFGDGDHVGVCDDGEPIGPEAVHEVDAADRGGVCAKCIEVHIERAPHLREGGGDVEDERRRGLERVLLAEGNGRYHRKERVRRGPRLRVAERGDPAIGDVGRAPTLEKRSLVEVVADDGGRVPRAAGVNAGLVLGHVGRDDVGRDDVGHRIAPAVSRHQAIEVRDERAGRTRDREEDGART